MQRKDIVALDEVCEQMEAAEEIISLLEEYCKKRIESIGS